MAKVKTNYSRQIEPFRGYEHFTENEKSFLVRIAKLDPKSPSATPDQLLLKAEKLNQIFRDDDACIFIGCLMKITSVNEKQCKDGLYKCASLRPLSSASKDSKSFLSLNVNVFKSNNDDIEERIEVNISIKELNVVEEQIQNERFECIEIEISDIKSFPKVAIAFVLEAFLTTCLHLQFFGEDKCEEKGAFSLDLIIDENITTSFKREQKKDFVLSLINSVIELRNDHTSNSILGDLKTYFFKSKDTKFEIDSEYNKIKTFLLQSGITPVSNRKVSDWVGQRDSGSLSEKDIVFKPVLSRTSSIFRKDYFHKGKSVSEYF